MTALLTTAQLADRIGIATRTVRIRAERLGIEPAMVAGHSLLWHARDLKRFGPPRPPGRPRLRE